MVYRPIFIQGDTVSASFGEWTAGYNTYLFRGDGMRIGVEHPHAPKSAIAFAPPPFTLTISDPGVWQVTVYDDMERPETVIRLAVPRLATPHGFTDRERDNLKDWERRDEFDVPVLNRYRLTPRRN